MDRYSVTVYRIDETGHSTVYCNVKADDLRLREDGSLTIDGSLTRFTLSPEQWNSFEVKRITTGRAGDA